MNYFAGIDLCGTFIKGGIVEENGKVALAGSRERPLAMCKPNSAMRQFNRISRRLEGFNVPLGRIR